MEYRIFGEQYHGNWWKREESELLLGQRLLSLILYSDATTLDHMGKSSGHPLFLSLGNIPNHQRNKLESKALIGYLPILKAKDSKMKKSDRFRKVQREIFQKCISIFLKPIVEEPELHFVVRGNIITFIPRISIIIMNMAEADKFANVYQPASSRRPCGKCLVSKDDLNNTNLIKIIPRTPDSMIQVIDSRDDQYYSLHPEKYTF